jgi:diguanylate cyclase (GGDEF)-like protein
MPLKWRRQHAVDAIQPAVDATLDDSFPASDPPSWTGTISRVVGPAERTAVAASMADEAWAPPRRSFWYGIAGAILSLAAPLGLLLLRELSLPRPVSAELLADRLTYIYVFLTTAAILGSMGFLLGRQADRLETLSETDALTGLANRPALRRRLSEEIARSRRYGDPVSLLLLDVDGLKEINDSRGHGHGDRVIQRVGTAIRDSLRQSDLGARWGGDEFAIIAPGTPPDAACRWAERLVWEVAQRSADRKDEPCASVSVGVTTFDPRRFRDVTIDMLLDTADEALYRAKRAGRNTSRSLDLCA